MSSMITIIATNLFNRPFTFGLEQDVNRLSVILLGIMHENVYSDELCGQNVELPCW